MIILAFSPRQLRIVQGLYYHHAVCSYVEKKEKRKSEKRNTRKSEYGRDTPSTL
jgi:hypothetical protein